MSLREQVEQKIDAFKRKRDAAAEGAAKQKYKEKMSEIGKAERRGEIGRELKEKWSDRARARYESGRVPPEVKIASAIGRGVEKGGKMIGAKLSEMRENHDREDRPSARQPRRQGRKSIGVSIPAGVGRLNTPVSTLSSGSMFGGETFGTGSVGSFGDYQSPFSGMGGGGMSPAFPRMSVGGFGRGRGAGPVFPKFNIGGFGAPARQAPAPVRRKVRKGKGKRRTTRRRDDYDPFRIF